MKTRCEKGHYYSAELPACPYCPQDKMKPIETFKTQNMNDNDKTKVIGDSHLGDTKATNVAGNPGQSTQRAFDKTTIVRPDEPTNKEDGGNQTPQAQRKIAGWLISYEHNPNGTDFRLYEGNNSVGRDMENNIVISFDASVSSKHALILFKKGQFFLRDEMAANGTFLNDTEIEIGQPVKLNDGDSIRFGKVGFKFRSVE